MSIMLYLSHVASSGGRRKDISTADSALRTNEYDFGTELMNLMQAQILLTLHFISFKDLNVYINNPNCNMRFKTKLKSYPPPCDKLTPF